MPSITKKIIKGRPYYYARECKRVDGKPKIVWQKYLGRAEDIIRRMAEDPLVAVQPEEAVVTEFGAVVALYDLARRLGLVEHVDRHVSKRGSGPSVGTYLLVAVLNRCVAPCSKASIGSWFRETALRRLLDIQERQLTSQRYWDNMDRIPHEAIVAIERDVMAHLVPEFDLDLRRVLFDATNFFTFIDTFNERSSLAQRGKSKEGRAALRIVGLALLVTADFHVPLLHRTYPGNQADSPTFASLTSELVARYQELTEGAEHVTLVFDKGNNSKDNLEAMEASPYHFIGSLVPTQHKELLETPAEKFSSLADDGLPGVVAYRTTKKVFGVKRTVVVTFNDKLFIAQTQTLLREIAKRQGRLAELQDRLRRRRAGEIRGGRPPTVASTTKKVTSWLKARHMKDLFHVDIDSEDGLPTLRYRFDTEAWEDLQRTLLGKTIVFTDNDDWTDAEIVRGYRAQHHVETAFRCMKDPHCIALRPQHCWTDQKVEVHVFTCVLALMLGSLLQRELHRRGIDRSLPSLLNDLGKIREVLVVYPPADKGGEPTFKMTMSRMSPDQRTLFEALDLGRYSGRVGHTEKRQ
jgi:transposase